MEFRQRNWTYELVEFEWSFNLKDQVPCRIWDFSWFCDFNLLLSMQCRYEFRKESNFCEQQISWLDFLVLASCSWLYQQPLWLQKVFDWNKNWKLLINFFKKFWSINDNFKTFFIPVDLKIRTTEIIKFIYPWTQWAAVTIQSFFIIDPPQKWKLPYICNDT